MSKILIVDDEPNIRLLMEDILEELEDEGVELLFAANGKEGLEIIIREKPKLVFLDIMMPEVNGYEVCATVKRRLKLEDVYIVLLTAKGQAFDKLKGARVGANFYITKPFRPALLREKARQVLGMVKE